MNNSIENIFSLKNKTALITGGSRGIGAEIALAFLSAGANVVCISRSELPIDERLTEFYKQCDIRNQEDFTGVCQLIHDQYGGIDILVNAAGITLPKSDYYSDTERFDRILSVNLTSVYRCCNTAVNFMNADASIINITSIGSMLGFPDNPGYVASKGGLRALTKSLAIDFSNRGVRVNSIAPGYILTDMTQDSFNNKAKRQRRSDRMIINRWGEVRDVSNAAIFLASSASSYITGIDLVVDGGWTSKGM